MKSSASSRVKRLLCLMPQVAGNGGIARFNRNLLRALQEDSALEVHTLALNDPPGGEGVRGFGGGRPSFMLEAAREIRRFRPELTLVGLLNFAPLSALKMLHAHRLVVILHGFEAWYRRRKLQPFYRWVDGFWAVSEYTRRTFARTNAVPLDAVHRIFNTVPDEWLDHPPPKREQPYFLTVTRLDRGEGYKGVDKTLEAVARLAPQMRAAGWSYRIVASGNDLPRHRELAAALGIADLVHFEQGLSDGELQQRYAECAFFVLPSTGEGFGIVFLEAMSYHKPCVGCRHCGTEDVIEHEGTGYLLEQTVEAIQGALQTLMNDPDLRRRMGRAGHRRLLEHFAFEHFRKRIHGLVHAEAPSRLPERSMPLQP